MFLHFLTVDFVCIMSNYRFHFVIMCLDGAQDDLCALQEACPPDYRCEPLPDFNVTCSKYFSVFSTLEI